MTRQNTSERTAQLQGGPRLVCMGRFVVDGRPVDFPYSEDDLSRDADYWGQVLRDHGVARGRRTVVSALAQEMPWSQAIRIGTTRAGAAFSNVEFWGWDARRLDVFLRRAQPYAVIGPGRELIEGLGGLADLAERLGEVSVLLVRPDAVEPLELAGVRPTGLLVPLGPTVAVSLADGSGLAVDEREWAVDEEDGELLITTVGPRAATFERERVGVRGQVQRTTAGARIVLED
jgi:hypothetical protein